MGRAKRFFGGRQAGAAALGFACACSSPGCAAFADGLRSRIVAEVWARGLLALVSDPEAEQQTVPGGGRQSAFGHNQRGQVLLQQGHFYEAVGEFESAIRAAPGWAEPREHLGRLYEAIGRSDQAILHYRAALALEPGRGSAMRRLARTCVNTGACNPEVTRLLERVAAASDDPRWRAWARAQLAWRSRS